MGHQLEMVDFPLLMADLGGKKTNDLTATGMMVEWFLCEFSLKMA